jgi:NTP pyrophosphatase (non-canonical NTP hydrolase)
MIRDIKGLIQLVEQWGHDKGITQTDDPTKQLLKTFSEAGELADALCKNDDDATKDAIGDIFVCLINYCAIVKLDIYEIYVSVKSGIDDGDAESKATLCAPLMSMMSIVIGFQVLFGHAIRPTQKADGRQSGVMDILVVLFITAEKHNTTLEECLANVYEIINKRTGQTKDGVFIKD